MDTKLIKDFLKAKRRLIRFKLYKLKKRIKKKRSILKKPIAKKKKKHVIIKKQKTKKGLPAPRNFKEALKEKRRKAREAFQKKMARIRAKANFRMYQKQLILNNLPEYSLVGKNTLFKTKLVYRSKLPLIERRLFKKYDRKLRFAFNRRKFLLKQYRQKLFDRYFPAFKTIFIKLKKKRRSKIRENFKKKPLLVEKKKKLSHLIERIIFRVIIRQSKNNMFLTYLNNKGRVLYTMSAGCIGLLGPQRSTPFASEQVGRVFGFQIRRMARYKQTFIVLKTTLNRHVRGCISFLGRAFKSFKGIIDLVPRPHNGLRKKKLRRL